jgi:ABC-type transporter Mla subunit MlaD
MLDWQARYREQVDDMVGQQTRVAENMEIATSRYEHLVSNAEIFSRVASSLSQLLDGLESQRGQITGSLEHLGKLLESTSDGLPKIEAKVIQLTEQITFGVK